MNFECSTIYTIGYEGLLIEEFTSKLKYYNISILVDVRKNPISRKRGFSKKKFAKALDAEGIKYFHFPRLGIDSSFRKELDMKNPDSYKKLFAFYDKNIIPVAEDDIHEIIQLATGDNNIALTCFEQDYHYCHRSRIAKEISSIGDEKVRILHI
jgi:uncharacterized protein (DUF488 family)